MKGIQTTKYQHRTYNPKTNCT